MTHVDFLNKNTLRSYPLRADTVTTSQEGVALPTALFCAAQFSVDSKYSKVSLNRVYVDGNCVNILVSAKNGDTLAYLGFFNGQVKADYQTLTFSAIDPGVYGMLVVGLQSALQEFQGIHTFGTEDMLIEDSLVTYVVLPNVKALLVDGVTVTGRIGLESSNVKEIVNSTSLQLDVVSKDSVRATNDDSAQFNSCPTNPIGLMNGVMPDPDNGNIDIYGIDPVRIRVTPIGLAIDAPGVNKQELCAEDKRIPPLISISTYLKDVTTASIPEWKSWPQYATV